MYVFVKLFVFDLDIWLIEHYLPSARWLVDYKLIILLLIIAASFLVFRRSTVLGWLAYVIFYPIIILLWKVPYLIFQQFSF